MEKNEFREISNGNRGVDILRNMPSFERHMQKMNTENNYEEETASFASTQLDYGGAIDVRFDFVDDEMKYEFKSKADDAHLGEKIEKNLYSISSIEKYDNDDDLWRLAINDTVFIDVDEKTGEVVSENKLTAFEVRMLAQSKESRVPFSRENMPDFRPKTDLHTHLAGAITAESMIKIGKKHDISYPIELARKIGLDTERYGDMDGIKINEMSDSDLEKLGRALILPLATQETFNKMEEVYDLREPFTKSKELFPDCLMEIAKDCQKNGVDYSELSFSRFLKDPDYMQIVDETMPKIEKETGVKLRFVASLSRHADHERNLDLTDSMLDVARKSPYIVGCDFMGQETNSTDSFKEELEMIARYAMEEDPNFTIRVHAGESPIFRNNVRRVLEIVNDTRLSLEEKNNKEYELPMIRIGHGLYGVDDEVVKMMRDMKVIVEFNMSSNLALNNINNLSEVPIKKYLDNGVEVVLGTDGAGIYSTSGEQETLLAMAAGLTFEDFEKIRMTEERAMLNEAQREEKYDLDLENKYGEFRYSTFDGGKRYTDDIAKQYKFVESMRAESVGNRLGELGIITDDGEIERATMGKIPILISGASKDSWEKISKADRENIELVMQTLVDVLNPETTYLVTGGTNFGVEKVAHEMADRKKRDGKSLIVLGTLTVEAAKEDNQGIEPNTITHATILENNGKKVKNWMDLPDTQLDYVNERGGCMIAVGGGSVVNNMIQRAHNMGMDLQLMDGPAGASSDKSKAMAGNGYSFRTAKELIIKLYNSNPYLFVDEFDVNKLDGLIEEAKNELAR